MGFDHIHTQLLPLPPPRPTSCHLQLLLSLWNQGCALDCGDLPRIMSLKKTDPHSRRSHPLVMGSPLEVTRQAQSLGNLKVFIPAIWDDTQAFRNLDVALSVQSIGFFFLFYFDLFCF